MGNTEGNLPNKESRAELVNSRHIQQKSENLMTENRRFSEANKMDRPRLDMMSASIRGEIMAIRAGRSWSKPAVGNQGELEIVDLRVGKRSCNSSPVEAIRENRYLGRQNSSEAAKRPRSPVKQTETRLKFGIDNILAKKTDEATAARVIQDQPKNLSLKERMESSSDYSSDECRGSEDSRRSPGSLSRSEEEEEERLYESCPPYKIARFERHLNPSPPKTLKFHPYHIKRSLSRNAAEQQELRHGIAPSPRARGKSESPKSARPVFLPTAPRRPSGSFVEVLTPNQIPLSLGEHRSATRAEFFPKNPHLHRLNSTIGDQRLPDVRPTFVHARSRASDGLGSSTFRSVSDTDDVFREDLGAFSKVARQISPDIAAKSRSQPQTTWRAFEPKSPVSSQAEIFRSICQQRERLANFPTFVDRGASLPSSPVSPASPNGFSLQAWQTIAANCHPSLRHLVYPYAYGGSTAAAAMALAAVRSFKTFAPGLGEVPVASQPSHPPSPAFDEKRKVPKKRRKWSRAVFSLNQRRGLERSFQVQKYVAKPERKGLAEALGLTDAQVKIWFQNRRMKWRQELKNSEKQSGGDVENVSPSASEQDRVQLVAQSC